MPRYICKKEDCEGRTNDVRHTSTVSKFEKKEYCVFEKKTNKKLVCEFCGEALELKEEEGEYSANFLKFDSMNDAGKKAVIKKRATKAFKKAGGDDLKLHRQKMALKKMVK